MKTSQIIKAARKEGRSHLLEPEAKMICKDYDIPVTEFKLAKSESEAVTYSEEIGYPVVLKIISQDALHKSDVGGVVLNVEGATEVKDAYQKILSNLKKHKPQAEVKGILIQEMVPSSTEVIVGATKDPQFGPTVMFGLGGVFVEILKDVTFRIAPLNEEEAREMITEVKAYPLLKGYRNRPPVDIEAIVNILLNASKLVMDHQEIKELDLNPVMVYKTGAITVDARIILD